MTQEIMSESLFQFDQIGIQTRQVVLFLDNTDSHPHELKLEMRK